MAVTWLFQVVVSLELVRVGLYFPLNGKRANTYAHVVVVRENVVRTLCSVGGTGARVAHPFPSNSYFVVLGGFTGGRHLVVSSRCFTGTGTG